MHVTEGCSFSCGLHTFKETKHFDQSLTFKKKAHHANLKFCILHLIILLQSKYYILLSAKLWNWISPLKQLKHLPAKVKNKT
jgi:hypothetical protein